MMLKSAIVLGVLAAFCAGLPATPFHEEISWNERIFERKDVVSDIEDLIQEAADKIEATVEGLIKDVDKAVAKLTATAEELVEAAEKAIGEAVSKVEQQIEELAEDLNDCAKAEADKLESVAEEGINKVQACVDDANKKAEAIAEDTKKKLHAASDKVQEAAKPIRACGELAPIQQVACKLKEEVKFTVAVSKISAALVADASAAVFEIGKVRLALGKCAGQEVGKGVAAVAKVGVDIAKCIV